MRGRSKLPVFVENAAEFLTTGNKKFTNKSVVIISSVSGNTKEMVELVDRVHEKGAKVFLLSVWLLRIRFLKDIGRMSAVTLSNCTETLCYVNSQVKRLIELFHLTIFRNIKSGGVKRRSLLSNHEINEDD